MQEPLVTPETAALTAYWHTQDAYQAGMDGERRTELWDTHDAAREQLHVIAEARHAAGLCCVLYLNALTYPCANPVDPAAGCSVCEACQEKERQREGAADGEAALRTNDYGWRDE